MPRDYIFSYMIPSVSVYYKVSFNNKDKFKKYGSRWCAGNKEWKITFEGCHSDSWKPIHDKIMTINKELNLCGSKIHYIEDNIGYLDEYNTFNLVLGKPREKDDWEIEYERNIEENKVEPKISKTSTNIEIINLLENKPRGCLIVDD